MRHCFPVGALQSGQQAKAATGSFSGHRAGQHPRKSAWSLYGSLYVRCSVRTWPSLPQALEQDRDAPASSLLPPRALSRHAQTMTKSLQPVLSEWSVHQWYISAPFRSDTREPCKQKSANLPYARDQRINYNAAKTWQCIGAR